MAKQATNRARPIWESREAQLAQISSAFRHSGVPIFAWGDPSTGKHSTVHAAIAQLAGPVETHEVDCVLEHGDSALFRALLPPRWAQQADSPPASAAALVDALDARAALPETPLLVLVLRRAERLCASHFRPDALRVVLSIPQLVQNPSRLRVVFISRFAWPTIRDRFDLNVWEPQCIYFAPYQEKEIVDGIVTIAFQDGKLRLTNVVVSGAVAEANGDGLGLPQGEAEKLFPAYVKATVAVLFPVTKDLRELARTCISLYPRYLAPLVENPDVPKQSLWSRFSSYIGEARGLLYHRELVLPKCPNTGEEDSDHDIETSGRSNHGDDLVQEKCLDVRGGGTTGESEMLTALLQLGRIPRLLLLATYLGMVNPPRRDLHYFSLETVRSRARQKNSRGGVSKSRERRKAASVPMNRIVALFDAIQGRGIDVGTRENSTSALSTAALVSFASLQSLSLVTRDRTSTGDISGDSKFRCDMSLETARELANSLGVPLSEYLHVDARE